jgi:hypothetical protein
MARMWRVAFSSWVVVLVAGCGAPRDPATAPAVPPTTAVRCPGPGTSGPALATGRFGDDPGGTELPTVAADGSQWRFDADAAGRPRFDRWDGKRWRRLATGGLSGLHLYGPTAVAAGGAIVAAMSARPRAGGYDGPADQLVVGDAAGHWRRSLVGAPAGLTANVAAVSLPAALPAGGYDLDTVADAGPDDAWPPGTRLPARPWTAGDRTGRSCCTGTAGAGSGCRRQR